MGKLRPPGRHRAGLPSQDIPSEPGSPFPDPSAGASREAADDSSGGWHGSQAICSQLPPAWVAATRPQPAPAPLTSRQHALTLSLCVLSNPPNIAARSLSTVLVRAYFPSPKGCQVCRPLPRWGHLPSCLALSPGTRRHRLPRGAWRSHSSFCCLVPCIGPGPGGI